MVDTGQKAMALLNEVRAEYPLVSSEVASNLALCRAIEQHEADKAAHTATIEGILKSHQAFRQKVSDAVVLWRDSGEEDNFEVNGLAEQDLLSFIIPAPKSDPLVKIMEALDGEWTPNEYAKEIRAALDALGFEIREKNDD